MFGDNLPFKFTTCPVIGYHHKILLTTIPTMFLHPIYYKNKSNSVLYVFGHLFQCTRYFIYGDLFINVVLHNNIQETNSDPEFLGGRNKWHCRRWILRLIYPERCYDRQLKIYLPDISARYICQIYRN